jgi:light-regulated signal transduction histidine kinase (bacteriophytochrome)
VVAELQRLHPERRVHVDIADGLVTHGDPGLLRAMFENLLGNSWKFTRKHEVARIEVGVAERDGERAYFVRDDGAGFDMAYANKLFRPFQRLHTMEDFEGTGIGLATVQRIVLRHGGRVWGEAAVERGATFYFVL